MSSYTQQNTDRPFGSSTASTGNTTASGLRTGQATESGTNTERTGSSYESSPLAHDQGTTTTQHHGHGHGHGVDTGLGHHKSHQEGTYVGKDTGVGGGDIKTTKTTTETFQRAHPGTTGTGHTTTTTGSGIGTDNQYSTTGHPSHHLHHGMGGSEMKTTSHQAEQAYPGVTGTGTHQAYSGVTDPSAGATTKGYGTGDTTGHYAGDTTTGTGTGTYPTTGPGYHSESHTSHHQHHLGGDHSHGVTGTTGTKPTMTDKIVGGAEKATGKMMSNAGMYQKGAERAAGESVKKSSA